MASKVLTDAQEVDLRQRMMNGETPNHLKNVFGIAVSSVYNYRDKFKAQGYDIPYVKRGRPEENRQLGAVAPVQSPGSNSKLAGVVAQAHPLRFIVNGIDVNLDPSVKHVSISKDAISVNF